MLEKREAGMGTGHIRGAVAGAHAALKGIEKVCGFVLDLETAMQQNGCQPDVLQAFGDAVPLMGKPGEYLTELVRTYTHICLDTLVNHLANATNRSDRDRLYDFSMRILLFGPILVNILENFL